MSRLSAGRRSEKIDFYIYYFFILSFLTLANHLMAIPISGEQFLFYSNLLFNALQPYNVRF